MKQILQIPIVLVAAAISVVFVLIMGLAMVVKQTFHAFFEDIEQDARGAK